jgi:hypothetical protein
MTVAFVTVVVVSPFAETPFKGVAEEMKYMTLAPAGTRSPAGLVVAPEIAIPATTRAALKVIATATCLN